MLVRSRAARFPYSALSLAAMASPGVLCCAGEAVAYDEILESYYSVERWQQKEADWQRQWGQARDREERRPAVKQTPDVMADRMFVPSAAGIGGGGGHRLNAESERIQRSPDVAHADFRAAADHGPKSDVFRRQEGVRTSSDVSAGYRMKADQALMQAKASAAVATFVEADYGIKAEQALMQQGPNAPAAVSSAAPGYGLAAEQALAQQGASQSTYRLHAEARRHEEGAHGLRADLARLDQSTSAPQYSMPHPAPVSPELHSYGAMAASSGAPSPGETTIYDLGAAPRSPPPVSPGSPHPPMAAGYTAQPQHVSFSAHPHPTSAYSPSALQHEPELPSSSCLRQPSYVSGGAGQPSYLSKR